VYRVYTFGNPTIALLFIKPSLIRRAMSNCSSCPSVPFVLAPVSPSPIALLRILGISSGRFKHDSVTLDTIYHVCFGNCGCERIRERRAGVIIAGRFMGGIGDGERESSWFCSSSALGPRLDMTYRESMYRKWGGVHKIGL